jgi:hypothetical protein
MVFEFGSGSLDGMARRHPIAVAIKQHADEEANSPAAHPDIPSERLRMSENSQRRIPAFCALCGSRCTAARRSSRTVG